MKIRFAVTPPNIALSEDNFPHYLNECEDLGFDTIWLSDIPLGIFGDPLISLSYAAAHTSRLKLGANFVPLGRHPLWFAKQLAQLDRLSHGRLLISFVPGLGPNVEREALGYPNENRGQVIDEMIGLMRRWWAGKQVTTRFESLNFDNITLAPLPIQQPLEVWLGGASTFALKRVGKLADGWLTSALTPAEAAAGRTSIEQYAATYSRTIDKEHFGISMPFAIGEPDSELLEALRARRKDRDLSKIVPVGERAIADLAKAHIDGGLSKFVLRPIDRFDRKLSWRGNLRWLADAVLPLQT